MQFSKSKKIKSLLTFKPKRFFDDRGYFQELYKSNSYFSILKNNFVQDNISISKINTIRGFHFQTNKPQGKLICCLRGSFKLFVIDLRLKSPTYLNFEKFDINEINGIQVYLPPGCANAVLSQKKINILMYKCTKYWNQKTEKGFNFFDNNITNLRFNRKYSISDKDLKLPKLEEIEGKYFKNEDI